MKKVFVVLLLAITVAAGVYAYFEWFANEDEEPLADPSTVDLPEAPDDPTTLREFLMGEGRPLVDFHTAVADFIGRDHDELSDACRAFLVDELDPIAPPAVLGQLANKSGNPSAVALFEDHLIIVMDQFGRCAQGEPLDREELEFSSIVVGRYLAEAGVS